ncbi:MAG: YjfB family protein [Peptoanaerobacter stomatis]|uniref:YjfB family protein n=1 Tax=Peptoanaerobacter stomatis TaxID=796937 RepID=UPI003FA07E30
MDMAAMSIALNSMKAMTNINMSLLKKTMDVTKENADLMLENMKKMELSVNPNLGSNFDMII